MINVLDGKQFADKNLLDKIFKRASELQIADAKNEVPKLLTGKVIATVFF